MKKLWATCALTAALVTAVSGCTVVDETVNVQGAPPASSAAPQDSNYPTATGEVDTNLVITELMGNNKTVTTRQLACSGDTAVAPSNIPDADEACALIAGSAKLFDSELVPTDNEACTDTGNDIIADVFGESRGEHVRVSFQRNNLCNARAWDKLIPIIGRG